jgi:quercetin dioxygenase-like cupin family protein
MEVKRAGTVPSAPVDGAPGASIRWLWAGSDGAPSFALRLIEVEPGASTPHHSHPYEHEVYVLSGHAKLHGEARDYSLEIGDTALVLPDEEHQFTNTGSDVLRFLCVIPLRRDKAS